MAILRVTHKGRPYYLLWSNSWDAPSHFAMTRRQLEEYLRREEGERYMRTTWPHVIERVEASGTSSGESPEAFILCNRAGPGESRITLEGIVYMYVERRERLTPVEMERFLWPDDDASD